MTSQSDMLRAILTDPADDAARLVYADLLEDDGQSELSAYIHEAVRTGESRDYRIGRTNSDIEVLCGKDPLPQFLYDHVGAVPCVDGLTFTLRRGFVERIELHTATLILNLARLFESQPITQIRLEFIDPPTLQTMRYSEEQERYWFPQNFWHNHILQARQLSQRDRISPTGCQALQNALENETAYRYFATPETALQVVSQTCVNFGRAVVGLPPLKPPDSAPV